MPNELIKKYINLLTIDHIKKYALANNIKITADETAVIYSFIKNNYQDLLTGNINSLLPLKEKINSNTYNKLVILYKEACIKYLWL